MKILYHHRIASKDGQYVHVEEMIKAFRKLGHEIIVVAPSISQSAEFGSGGGIVSLLKQFVPSALYELIEFFYSIYAYRRLSLAIKEHNPDVIYERYNLFFPAGIWAKKKYNLPLLLEINAPLYEERNKYDSITLKKLARWTERYTWQGAEGVLPVTEVLAGKVHEQGVPKERMIVVHNGIDRDKFDDIPDINSAKKRLGLEGRLVLGFTGFARDWHGLDKVVDLVVGEQSYPRHLLIVGDGPARASIEKRAKELDVGDRVTITGIINREQVASYVSAFDIALQPDVVDYASPLKIFEYLALGRAIIAPRKDNISEILSHEDNALLFQADNQDSFYRTIETLCEDSQLRRRISSRAKETIDEKKFTWVHNAERVIIQFENLLKNKNA